MPLLLGFIAKTPMQNVEEGCSWGVFVDDAYYVDIMTCSNMPMVQVMKLEATDLAAVLSSGSVNSLLNQLSSFC